MGASSVFTSSALAWLYQLDPSLLPHTACTTLCYTTDACYTGIVGCETVHDILLPYTDVQSRVQPNRIRESLQYTRW